MATSVGDNEAADFEPDEGPAVFLSPPPPPNKQKPNPNPSPRSDPPSPLPETRRRPKAEAFMNPSQNSSAASPTPISTPSPPMAAPAPKVLFVIQGYALIEYENFDEAQAAIKSQDESELLAQTTYVNWLFSSGSFKSKNMESQEVYQREDTKVILFLLSPPSQFSFLLFMWRATIRHSAEVVELYIPAGNMMDIHGMKGWSSRTSLLGFSVKAFYGEDLQGDQPLYEVKHSLRSKRHERMGE